MKRVAFVDDMAYAREFAPGDLVRQSDLRDLFFSPYVGRVVWSNPRTGMVQVQWPWGADLEPATTLVRDLSENKAAPQSLDQTLSSYEGHIHSHSLENRDAEWLRPASKRKASGPADRFTRIVERYEQMTLPIWRAACRQWHIKSNEVNAFLNLSRELGPDFGTDAIRITVGNVYELGRRLSMYWKDSNRKYRVTQREKTTGKLECPRCNGVVKPRVYRQGQKILMCSSCGFSIHPEDLL